MANDVPGEPSPPADGLAPTHERERPEEITEHETPQTGAVYEVRTVVGASPSVKVLIRVEAYLPLEPHGDAA